TLRGRLRGEDSVYTSFDVAEYRPAEFKVEVASASPAYVRGAAARFSVQADYLFGAPMAGAGVHYSVTRAPASAAVPGSDGFVTDASTYYADLGESAL